MRCIGRLLLGVIGYSVLVWFHPVPAWAQGQCFPVQAVIEHITKAPIYQSHQSLNGFEMKTVSAILNAIPPETDFQFTTGILIDHRDGGGALLFGNDGLICFRKAFDAQHWHGVRAKIVGTGI